MFHMFSALSVWHRYLFRSTLFPFENEIQKKNSNSSFIFFPPKNRYQTTWKPEKKSTTNLFYSVWPDTMQKKRCLEFGTTFERLTSKYISSTLASDQFWSGYKLPIHKFSLRHWKRWRDKKRGWSVC